jgi:oligoribonuclease
MKKFFWLDLEMTGLDDKTDCILEVAAVVTDLNLSEVERFQQVVHQPTTVLENMNDWCKKHHGESGLTAAVPSGKPLAQVEDAMIALLDRHFASDDKVVLCGNSIHNDRRFVDRYLPRFAKRLHYRLIGRERFYRRLFFRFRRTFLHQTRFPVEK